MKGIYKTKEGRKVEVLDFDEANKIARIEEGWVGEQEYKEWESLEEKIEEPIVENEIAVVVDENEISYVEPQSEEPIVEEEKVVKPKKGRPKKTGL